MKFVPHWLALAICAALIGSVVVAPWTASNSTVSAAQPGPREEFEPDEYEPDDSPEDAHELIPGEEPQVRSLHHAADIDWTYIELAAGDRVALFTLGSTCDPVLILYGPDGTGLAADDDSGQGLNAFIDYTVGESGTHYVRTQSALREPCSLYGLAAIYLEPIPPDDYEPDDFRDEARPFAFDGVGQARSAHLRGDMDWIAFPMEPGDRIRLYTESDCDTVLDVFAPNGVTRLASDDDSGSGNNALIELIATRSGVHYARVGQYEDGVCEAYQLIGVRLPTIPADAFERDDGAVMAKPLPLDGTVQPRTLHTGEDTDWVSFPLRAEDVIVLLAGGTDCNLEIGLFAPDGSNLLTRSVRHGSDQAIIYTVFEAGTFYARVRGIGSTGACEGYQLRGSSFPSRGVRFPGNIPVPVTTPAPERPPLPAPEPTPSTEPVPAPSPEPSPSLSPVPSPSLSPSPSVSPTPSPSRSPTSGPGS